MGREGVKSDETLFEILEALKRLGGAGATEIADNVGIAKSTAHRHLTVLHRNEFIVKDDDQYRLGLRFLDYGGHVCAENEHYQAVKPKVRELAEETGELAQFIVEDHGLGVYVFRESGEKAVTTEARVGKRVPLHHTSAGKAILAQLPTERVDNIIARHGLPRRTDNTITDSDELYSDLEQIRERGYAFDMDEHIKGLWAIGAPIMSPDGEVLGGLSVAGPTHRMKDDEFQEEVPKLLLGLINELELNMTYS
jgi:DNA-binding IclR family transcriptional regulator